MDRIKSRQLSVLSKLGNKYNVIRLERVCSVKNTILCDNKGRIMSRPIKNARRLDGCRKIYVLQRTYCIFISSVV